MLGSPVSPAAGQAALEGGRAGCRVSAPPTQRPGAGVGAAGAETHRARRRPPVAQQGRGRAVDCLGPSCPQPGSPARTGNPLETRGAGRSGEPWEGQRQGGVSRVDGEGRPRFPSASTGGFPCLSCFAFSVHSTGIRRGYMPWSVVTTKNLSLPASRFDVSLMRSLSA